MFNKKRKQREEAERKERLIEALKIKTRQARLYKELLKIRKELEVNNEIQDKSTLTMFTYWDEKSGRIPRRVFKNWYEGINVGKLHN